MLEDIGMVTVFFGVMGYFLYLTIQHDEKRKENVVLSEYSDKCNELKKIYDAKDEREDVSDYWDKVHKILSDKKERKIALSRYNEKQRRIREVDRLIEIEEKNELQELREWKNQLEKNVKKPKKTKKEKEQRRILKDKKKQFKKIREELWQDFNKKTRVYVDKYNESNEKKDEKKAEYYLEYVYDLQDFSGFLASVKNFKQLIELLDIEKDSHISEINIFCKIYLEKLSPQK